MAGSAPGGGRGVMAPNHSAAGTASAERSAKRGAAAGR